MDRRTGAVGDTAPGGKENMFRRGKVGDPLRRSERETSGPCEPLQPGEVRDTRCADFRCRWPVVDESLRSGPMRASASTTARAARSEAERAEREAGQMRSCTPTTSAPSATGRQLEKSQKSIACPKAGPNRRLHRSAAPRRAEGHCTGARPSGLFFWTVHGPFSFRARPKRKWGVHPAGQAPCGSKDSRGRRTAALYISLRSDRPAR